MGAQGLNARRARVEQSTLRVEDVQLARDAVYIAQPRKAGGHRERFGTRALRLVALTRARLRYERRTHFAEGVLDGPLVLRQRGALARLRRLASSLEPPALKDRLRQGEPELPYARGAAEEVAERRALASEAAGQHDRGKQ